MAQFNLGTDPGVAGLRALLAQQLAFAESSALAAMKQRLIDYGDPQLSLAVLGGDQLTSAASGNNPFSTVASLAYAAEQAKTQLDDQLNKANLWYSSTRQDRYGMLGRDVAEQQYGAARSIQDALTGINEALTNTRFQHQLALSDETRAAAMRQQDLALQFGLGGGGQAPTYQPFDFGSALEGLPEPAGPAGWSGRWFGRQFQPTQKGLDAFRKAAAKHGTSVKKIVGNNPAVGSYWGL